MKGLLGAIFIVITLLCPTSLSFAESQEWADKDFDFSTVKSVYLAEPNIECPVDEIVGLQARDYFSSAAEKIKSADVLTENLLVNKMIGASLISGKKQTNAQIIRESMPKFADVWVQAALQKYHVAEKWNEGYTRTVTTHEDITIDRDGKKTVVSVPRTKEIYYPGYYIKISHVKVKFNVYAAKDDKLVYSYVDYREAPKDLDGIYERIVRSFYDKLEKKLK